MSFMCFKGLNTLTVKLNLYFSKKCFQTFTQPNLSNKICQRSNKFISSVFVRLSQPSMLIDFFSRYFFSELITSLPSHKFFVYCNSLTWIFSKQNTHSLCVRRGLNKNWLENCLSLSKYLWWTEKKCIQTIRQIVHNTH